MRHSPRQGGRRPAIVALIVIGLALVLAACSPGASQPSVATLTDPSAATSSASPSPSVDPEEAMLAFERCMREHGVNVQSNTGGQNDTGATEAELTEALEACGPLLPQGGQDGTGSTLDPDFQEKLLAFARCMREHGIDYPDPQFDGSGSVTVVTGIDTGSGLDPEAEEFKAAAVACDDPFSGSGPTDVTITDSSEGSKP